MSVQLPRAGYQGIGARARWRVIEGDAPAMTVNEALKQCEAEGGRPLTLQERREFFAGWRYGAISEAFDALYHLSKRMGAQDIEALGAELQALKERWKNREV